MLFRSVWRKTVFDDDRETWRWGDNHSFLLLHQTPVNKITRLIDSWLKGRFQRLDLGRSAVGQTPLAIRLIYHGIVHPFASWFPAIVLFSCIEFIIMSDFPLSFVTVLFLYVCCCYKDSANYYYPCYLQTASPLLTSINSSSSHHAMHLAKLLSGLHL